jgi:hypothetical protein
MAPVMVLLSVCGNIVLVLLIYDLKTAPSPSSVSLTSLIDKQESVQKCGTRGPAKLSITDKIYKFVLIGLTHIGLPLYPLFPPLSRTQTKVTQFSRVLSQKQVTEELRDEYLMVRI